MLHVFELCPMKCVPLSNGISLLQSIIEVNPFFFSLLILIRIIKIFLALQGISKVSTLSRHDWLVIL